MVNDERLKELDALRGIAALAVVFFHFTINQNAEKLGWQFKYGVTGVDLFFMISGFIIFLTINKAKTWQNFAVSRFARLYPAYWACIFITSIFILIYDFKNFDIVQVAANLTMFPAYFSIEDLDGSYWTLLIELTFYLWILILYVTGNIKNTVIIALFFTLFIILFHFYRSYYFDFYQFATIKIQLLNHFPLFFSGIIFYNIKFKPFSIWNFVLLFFCLTAAFYLHDKGGRSMYFVSQKENTWILIFYHLVFGLFVTGKLKFLIHPVLIFFGEISYTLYLLHQYIGLRLIYTLNESLNLNIYLAIILTILICIGLAQLVSVYVEVPMMRRIRSWHKKYDQPESKSDYIIHS